MQLTQTFETTINQHQPLTNTLKTTLLACLAGLLLLINNSAYANTSTETVTAESGITKIYVNGERLDTSSAKAGESLGIQLEKGEHIIKVVIEKELYHLEGEQTVIVTEDTLHSVQVVADRKILTEAGIAKQRADSAAAPVKQAVIAIEESMVIIPAGSFSMGCGVSGKNCRDDERPVHKVTVPSFAMQNTEVTFEQWDTCVTHGPCMIPQDNGWGRKSLPVINTSWDDAQVYIQWLNSVSQGGYRLPTEAEWEYATDVGSQTQYSWGNSIGSNNANCEDCGNQWYNKQTAPVASFSPNPFGLYDMHGNVWEWTQDCWNEDYQDAPSNGDAWLSGDCDLRVIRGGSWSNFSWYLRAANRNKDPTNYRKNNRGFRLAKDL